MCVTEASLHPPNIGPKQSSNITLNDTSAYPIVPEMTSAAPSFDIYDYSAQLHHNQAANNGHHIYHDPRYYGQGQWHRDEDLGTVTGDPYVLSPVSMDSRPMSLPFHGGNDFSGHDEIALAPLQHRHSPALNEEIAQLSDPRGPHAAFPLVQDDAYANYLKALALQDAGLAHAAASSEVESHHSENDYRQGTLPSQRTFGQLRNT
ncbi:hypothetical protein HDV03_001394 [Kappamyces sp. JEL0829]|nr:hypothetical protein HDV03_001394 [Kappamyces sp. JEL0829]